MDPHASHLPLRTERLSLRDSSADDDWRDVHAYASDPEVVKYMQWGPNSEAQSAAFMERERPEIEAVPRLEWELALELRAEARLIGACGLRIRSVPHRQADLGYVLNRAYWGQGLMTEACAALLAFGFGVLGLHRVWATTDPQNRASIRVLEKLGMRHEGHLRHDKWLRTGWRDSALYAVIEPDWARRGGGVAAGPGGIPPAPEAGS